MEKLGDGRAWENMKESGRICASLRESGRSGKKSGRVGESVSTTHATRAHHRFVRSCQNQPEPVETATCVDACVAHRVVAMVDITNILQCQYQSQGKAPVTGSYTHG